MKYHPHGSVLFISFSMEQGLLMLSNPLCEAIIKSCLARALYKYPVRICGFLIEANHVHMVVVVINPNHVPEFIRHFKVESAHAFNRILGRRKRTIWCAGYDSPIVLTRTRTLIALSYLYSNPAKDNLEDSIAKYPGISSWQMFRKGEHKKVWKRIQRPAYKYLPKDSHNLRGYTKEAERLLASTKKTHEFTIEPNAWMESFGISSKEEQKRINQRLIARVSTLEKRARKKREREGKQVLGATQLINQTLNVTYLSKRSGKRMWCLCEDRDFRIRFIQFLKDLFSKARAVRTRWALGDYSEPYPLGLYPPTMPKLAEPLSIW
jgi:REP element-mobilizing transposase RayT/hemerythrin